MLAYKTEVIERIAEKGELNKGEAEELLNVVIEVFEEVVIEDLKDVNFGRLGSFKLKETPARKFHHPTKDTFTVKPRRKRITFVPNTNTQKEIEKRTAIDEAVE